MFRDAIATLVEPAGRGRGLARPALAASVLVGALLIALSAAGGAFAAANGKIAFERSNRIWTKSPALAATETQLRNDGLTDSSPAYSPDGLRLAFVRNTPGPEIFVGRADGTGPVRRLTTNSVVDSVPAWSSDGTRLVFQRGADIWVMNADGTGQHEISIEMPGDALEFDGASPSLYPAWSPPRPGSPDGRIAFIHGGVLWTMEPTGADKQPLPHTCPTDNGICDPAEAEPAWSPDGSALSFTYFGDIYLLPLPSGISVPLSRAEDGRFPGAQNDSAWSPNGRFIVFESAPPADSNDVAYARSSGLDLLPRLITDHTSPDSSPTWQPRPICTNDGATAGADVITGTAGPDVLCGLGGNDTIDADRGADIVLAGGGGDRIVGGRGNDVIDGGPGGDTVDYALAAHGVRASLTTEFATGDGYDVLLGLERIDGSPFADFLTGSSSNNLLRGFGGADTLDVRDGVTGNDTVVGGGAVDICRRDAGDRRASCP